MSRNQKIFLSISINNKPPNRITIELFSNTTPKTAQHFLSLCTGENPKKLRYKNSTFHRVLPGLCQGGAIGDPHLQENISFGEKAENFIRKHDGPGTVSMVNPGGTQFFIATASLPNYDGGYVVVGRVFDGMSVVGEVQSVGSLAGKTSVPVVIVDCGLIRDHANVGSEFSFYQDLNLSPVVAPSTDEEMTSTGMPRRGRGRPLGSGWRQKLAQVASPKEQVMKCMDRVSTGMESSLVSVPTPSSGEETITTFPTMPRRGRGRPLGSGWRQKLAQVASPKEQVMKFMDRVSTGMESSLVSVPTPSSGEETITTFPTMPINPKVYLDITINNQPIGRITIELFADTTPQTANHFLSLCTGNNPARLHYKGSTFHRVVPGLCQGGNIHSLSGKAKAENFIRKHDGLGTVSLVSPRGPQFFILTTSSPMHDGKYVVVGHVVQGLEVVDAVQTVGSLDGKTTLPVVIVDCGQIREELAPASGKSSTTPVEVIDCDEMQEELAPALEKSSTTRVDVIAYDEVQEHANMGLEVSLISVARPSSGKAITTGGMPSRDSPPGSVWRQKLARIASEQEQEIKPSDHANMVLESSLDMPSSGEKITTSGMPLKNRSGGRKPGSGWRLNPIRIASQQEQEISTSNGQFSNSLKEIIDVNTQRIAVDATDVLVIESEKNLVEVSVVSEHNLDSPFGLRAGVCSVDKHQTKLLSHTRTQVSSIKKKKRMIKMLKYKKFKSASSAKHVDTSSLNSGCQVVRKCFRCEITRNPCRRSGPLGPKTLNHSNMGSKLPSSQNEIIRGQGRQHASQKMSYKEFEQVISTSNKQLSECLKEIMNVNKKMIDVDAKDAHVLESETESVEDVLEHNQNVLLDLKAEVCSLEKRQTELLSQTRTKIFDVKNKRKKLVLEMIPSLSYEDLINVEDLIKKRKIDCTQFSCFK